MAFLSTSMYSQSGSILNKIGVNGSFVVWDSTTTFLLVKQNTGNITLGNSLILPLSYGVENAVIYKTETDGNIHRFIHSFMGSGSYGINTFVGEDAGNFTMGGSLYQGSSNSAVGAQSFQANTSGYANSSLGVQTLLHNTTGYQNAAVGANALTYNTSGFCNSAMGQSALVGNTTGYYNSALGYLAGNDVTTGSNLTLVGYNAEPSSGAASNQVTLGNNQITSLRCAVQSISTLSDARDKKNIKNLELGLDFLMKLQPRQFNWDKREWYPDAKPDGTKMQKTPTAGFIAQELDKAQMSENAEWLNLVLKENPNRIEATAGNLLPIMVKAIQDLKLENDALKAKAEITQADNTELKTTTAQLLARLSKFEKMQSQMVSEIEKLKANLSEVSNVSLGTK